MDRQRCEGGSIEAPISIASSSPPSAAAGKRKVIPTLKAAVLKTDDEASRRKSSRVGLGTKPSLANPPPRLLKRLADDQSSEEEAPRLSKVARKSLSSSQSSGPGLSRFVPEPQPVASHSPGQASAPSDINPLLMRLNALEENMRHAHKENLRRMDELRSLILQELGGR